MGFISLLREPDSILVQTDSSGPRFEEEGCGCSGGVDYLVAGGCGRVIVYPSAEPVRRVKLRWRGDFSWIQMVLGDDWERSEGLRWASVRPHEAHPWYFHAHDGARTHGYGVKTGADSLCCWQVDSFGISLWVDVRCGGVGVSLREPLEACSVVEREGEEGETAFAAAHAFCRVMCEHPVLPGGPVYGVNNWYWAYGMIDHAKTIEETEYLMELSVDAEGAPYMVIDDGWQESRFRGAHSSYNGGPWQRTNEFYPDGMRHTAGEISRLGARPGIWLRPLLTLRRLPAGVELSRPGDSFTGQVMDPSCEFTLNVVREDVARIAGWGYEMIKHDFSTMDALRAAPGPDGWSFYDRTKTTAQIMKNLYRVIQEAAGGALVIGCNTFGHLSAGIHALQRTGGDTSGRAFEWTRRNGVNTLMRLPQNGALFMTDPDCAAFTGKVSHEMNLRFMEVCAITGSALFASITPGCLSGPDFRRVRDIFALASRLKHPAHPVDWMNTDCPARYEFEGEERAYDWYEQTDGARLNLTWMG